MNIYKKDGISIDFSVRLNRFSVSQNTEWISLSPTTFHLLLCLLQTDSNYERVKTLQKGSEVEILKLYENYLVTFTSRTINSSITLKKNILESISTNYDRNIIKKFNVYSHTTTPIQARKKKRSILLNEEETEKETKLNTEGTDVCGFN